jgi:hypothetical protein
MNTPARLSRTGDTECDRYMSARVTGMRYPLALVAFLILVLLSVRALATDSQNRCHDPATMADWERLLSENPRDPVVIRLYGLRRGLCSMIDDGLVELDQAIEIFNTEHAKSVVERYNEEQGRERKLRLWGPGAGDRSCGRIVDSIPTGRVYPSICRRPSSVQRATSLDRGELGLGCVLALPPLTTIATRRPCTL